MSDRDLTRPPTAAASRSTTAEPSGVTVTWERLREAGAVRSFGGWSETAIRFPTSRCQTGDWDSGRRSRKNAPRMPANDANIATE